MRCGRPSRFCAPAPVTHCLRGCRTHATRICAGSRSPQRRAPVSPCCFARRKPPANRLPQCCGWRSNRATGASRREFSSAGACRSLRRSAFQSGGLSMLWAALHLPSLQSQALSRGHAPPEAGREALAAIATWLGQFTPKVTLEPPHGLAAEIQGSLRLYGGVGRLRTRLRAGLAELGFEASIAFAATARAALWRAAGGGGALEELPVEVTRPEPEALQLLRGLGIRSLGDLIRLPRDGVTLRFGAVLLAELDRALGKIPEPRRFFVPPARFAARLELPAPVSQAEGVLFAARRLLVQLEGFLAARHAGVRDLTLTFLHDRAQPTLVAVGLAGPARDAAHFLALTRERLHRVALAAPVEAIRI